MKMNTKQPQNKNYGQNLDMTPSMWRVNGTGLGPLAPSAAPPLPPSEEKC